jgi:hypothetical protein
MSQVTRVRKLDRFAGQATMLSIEPDITDAGMLLQSRPLEGRPQTSEEQRETGRCRWLVLNFPEERR